MNKPISNYKSIYNYSKEWYENYFQENKVPKFRATQLFEALYRQKAKSVSEINNINKAVKEKILEDFTFEQLKCETKISSEDGTTKFLFSLEDGNLIETVMMVHTYGYSVCVTSQVGCNMGCAFCASGQVKKIRNLTTSEMVLQVLTIDDYLNKMDKKVSHVVVMGIGEPFDNYDNVMEFIKIINDAKGLEIGARHITVSTCGIVPKIIEFSDFPLQVNLAISLHFPNDIQRNLYMKINKKYNLKELLKAVEYYYKKTNRRVTFEYILLNNINDGLDSATELVKLLKGFNAYINLIPYNSTGSQFQRSSIVKRDAFFSYLNKQGMNAIVRKEHGSEIDAACGQLRVKTIEKNLESKKDKK